MLEEFDTILFATSRKLDAAGIPHMLTGSFALAFYAHEIRATNDLDLLIDATEEHAPALADMFPREEGWYLNEGTMRQALARRGMFNAIHTVSQIKVDLIQLRSGGFDRQKLERRTRIEREGTGFWIISPEDLLLSKLAWGMPSDSALQMRDVRTLLRDHPEMDWNYVNQWADSIGVREWLEKARSK